MPLLGGALGPVAKTLLEASAVMPVLKEVMKFADVDAEKVASMLTPPVDGGALNAGGAPMPPPRRNPPPPVK